MTPQLREDEMAGNGTPGQPLEATQVYCFRPCRSNAISHTVPRVAVSNSDPSQWTCWPVMASLAISCATFGMACGHGSVEESKPQRSAPSTEAEADPKGADTQANDPPPPTATRTPVRAGPELLIGFASTPPEPRATVTRALQDALAAHRRRDYSGSVAAFAAIVDQAPEYAAARYNLACALSRVGELEHAATELETLLRLDLPHYRRRLEEDADLAALRDSRHGQALRQMIVQLVRAWRSAVSVGVPMVMWRRVAGRRDRFATLRAGVWLPEAKRFVPLGPAKRSATAALVDPELAKVVIVSERWGADGGPLEFEVHPLYGEHPSEVTGDATNAVDYIVEATVRGARFRTMDEPMGLLRNRPWTHVGQGDDATKGVTRRPLTSSQATPGRATPGRATPGRATSSGTSGWTTRRWSIHGGWLRPPGYHAVPRSDIFHSGWEFRGNAIRGAEDARVALSRGHGIRARHFLLETPGNPGSVHAWSVTATWPSEPRPSCSHVLDWAEQGASRATKVHEGPGTLFLRYGPDGRLWVQIGTRTQNMRSPNAIPDEAETTMEGVGLWVDPCS